jgi:hypothetical protein
MWNRVKPVFHEETTKQCGRRFRNVFRGQGRRCKDTDQFLGCQSCRIGIRVRTFSLRVSGVLACQGKKGWLILLQTGLRGSSVSREERLTDPSFAELGTALGDRPPLVSLQCYRRHCSRPCSLFCIDPLLRLHVSATSNEPSIDLATETPSVKTRK